MSLPEVYTYFDAVARLRQISRVYAGSPDDMLYMAVQDAYRRFGNEHDWSWLEKHGRIALEAADDDATCEFDLTGGATCERQLTISGSTFTESTAPDMAVKIGDVICEVERYYTSTVVQLDAVLCPPADIDSGTSCTIFRRWYPLPNDWQAMAETMPEGTDSSGGYVSSRRMENLSRFSFQVSGVVYWTVRAAPGLLGSYAVFVHGASDSAETYDILYKRRMRPLRFHGESSAEYAGTVAVTEGSTAVTGTSTQFSANHVGSILRIGTSNGAEGASPPTGWEGDYPYGEQRSILSVTNSTSLTLDANIVTSYTTAKPRITDPLDLPVDMYPAFLKCCEMEYARLTRLPAEEQKSFFVAYRDELQRAKNADCRVHAKRVVGPPRYTYSRLADNTARDTD